MCLSLIERKLKTTSPNFNTSTLMNQDFSSLNLDTLVFILSFYFGPVIQLLTSTFVLKISKDLSKGLLYGELKHVAREKEHCTPRLGMLMLLLTERDVHTRKYLF